MSGRDAPLPAWLPAALWSGATVLVASLVGRYWIPLDDGTLAQSAERVLEGQLPHVDFGDPYTGLGAMLGALAFRAFGVSLASLRIPLVVGFAAWLPALWLVARRLAPPRTALAATSLAALLSVLAYPAAMPTWFGLFLVTWGLLFLITWMDGGSRAWLAAAGAAAAVATLFKVVGLYALAASLLACAWRRADGSTAYRALALAGCGTFLVVLARLLAPAGGMATTGLFFVPALAVCCAVLTRAWRPGVAVSAGTAGVRPLLIDAAALMAGFAAPVALFLVPYAARGGLAAWLDGVFLRPGLRFESAASPPGSAWTLLCGVGLVVLLAGGTRLRGTTARWAALALVALLAAGLALDDLLDGAFLATLWYALRTATPALVFWGAWRLVRAPTSASSGPALAVLATAALWALVQYPYAAPAYFFYLAPLAALAALAAASAPGRGAPAAHPAGLGPIAGVLAGVAAYLGAGYAFGVAATGAAPLELERGRIRVSAADADAYADLVRTIDAHVGSGSLWAGPDAPEVYFLGGHSNPTPVLYEFLSSEPGTDPVALTDPDVTVAVVNVRPLFSEPLGPDALTRLAQRFPESRDLGRWVVRWRRP